MADCKKYREMISCYIDGELSENDKNELERHMEECASCRSLLSLYKSITGAIAEALSEPPDNFTDTVMNQIKLLSESEKTILPTANKPKKSLRPVVISFVAAAACLALAFIVSPQLFSLRGMSNTAASMPSPMASAAYGAASDEVLNNSVPDAEMKAAEGADADGENGDSAGTAPQIQMAPAVVTAAPMPSGSQAPEFSVSGREVTDALKVNYAVFVIEGQLPDALQDSAMTDNNDGTFSIEISVDMANALIKDGFEVKMGTPDATKALVINIPAE